MTKPQIILGIDPGTRITGYGIIRLGRPLVTIDYGCIKPPANKPAAERYRLIFEGLQALMDQYKPTACAIETQYVDKNVQSAIKLGMARGVATLAATLREIPVFEYAPTRAKKAVVGTGRASKQQVQRMIRHLLNLKHDPEPEDAADALALAICHSHHLGRSQHV